MSTDPLLFKLELFFTGLKVTQESIKNIEDIYNPTLALKFNPLSFFNPGENKISEILAFFLDPAETHGQGTMFLDLFISRFPKASIDSNFNHVKVFTEHHTHKQRRIDILIVLDEGKFAIGIENKIWAKDEKDQLIDYITYLRDKFHNNFALLYLTPYNSPPSTSSISEVEYNKIIDKKLFLIDYSTEVISLIKMWISHCRAEKVRSFLGAFEQFLQEKINGQTYMNEHQIIADYVLKTNDRIHTALSVIGAASEIKQSLIKTFIIQLKDLADDLALEVIISKGILGNRYDGFTFKDQLLHNNNVMICFEFQENAYKVLIFGIKKIDKVKESSIGIIQKKLINLPVKSHSSESWPWYAHFENHFIWNNQTYLAISNHQLIKDIREKVIMIREVIHSSGAIIPE